MANRRLVAALLPLALAACARQNPAAACAEQNTAVTREEAVVVFAFNGNARDTLRVLVRNRETIAAAQQFIRACEGAHIPIGPIARGAGPADPRYPFHFLPDSVRLAEITIELCDGAPMRTPAEVNAFFEGATGDANAPTAPYCPWSAYPVRVE